MLHTFIFRKLREERGDHSGLEAAYSALLLFVFKGSLVVVGFPLALGYWVRVSAPGLTVAKTQISYAFLIWLIATLSGIGAVIYFFFNVQSFDGAHTWEDYFSPLYILLLPPAIPFFFFMRRYLKERKNIETHEKNNLSRS